MLESNLLLLVEGSLKRERQIQRERHKSIRFNTQNNNSAAARVVSTLYSPFHSGLAFVPSLHDYDVKPQCPISRFLEDVNSRQRLSFLFPELRYSPILNSTPEKFAKLNEME